jgi:hypothetical protein
MSEIFKQVAEALKIDGLWTAEFGSSAGSFGGGVAVFQNGRILGGDGTYFYVGEYKLEDGNFEATLRISPFIDGAQSVFKTVGQDLTLELIGSVSGGRAIGQGHLRGKPDVKFGVKLTKRS